MSLSRHHQYQLHLIEAGILRSDPRLAGMLGVFDRLSAGQTLPAWEQMPSRQDRIRQATALIAETFSVMAAVIIILLRAVHALLAAVVQGGRARPPGRRRDGANPGQGTGGRQDPSGWS